MANKHGIDEPRFTSNDQTDALEGEVSLSIPKLLWIGSMYAGAIVGFVIYPSIENIAVFIIVTAIVLCLGHSLGMHRRLIHNSYNCPKWLESTFVYLGTLVGLGGPFTMIYTHDIRDWAQRQPFCHDYFAHRASFLKDAYWQIFCSINLKNPPQLELEAAVASNRFYQFIEKTAILQQLFPSLLLLAFGGIEWVLWGTCARVSASVTGHWLIGHFAHKTGQQHWRVNGAGVQGYNIKFCGLITFGESWHNNHHAFPGSAKIGLYPGQSDPGWWVLKTLEKGRLVWDIQTPEKLSPRPALEKV